MVILHDSTLQQYVNVLVRICSAYAAEDTPDSDDWSMMFIIERELYGNFIINSPSTQRDPVISNIYNFAKSVRQFYDPEIPEPTVEDYDGNVIDFILEACLLFENNELWAIKYSYERIENY